MVKPSTVGGHVKKESKPKKTSDGCSRNTRYKSKNDKKNKKIYVGQGR